MSANLDNKIVLYDGGDSGPELQVRLEDDTVWLSQQQITELFQTTRENITIHLRNVFSEGELEEAATSKDFLQVRIEGHRSVKRNVAHYNLDAIISVGYRVKSKTATRFRIWATKRLKDFLVEGYAINQTRLEQLSKTIEILGRSDDHLIAGVAEVLQSYVPGLTVLRDYDSGTLAAKPTAKPSWQLTLEEARHVIAGVAKEFPEDTLLGNERGDAKTIHFQTAKSVAVLLSL